MGKIFMVHLPSNPNSKSATKWKLGSVLLSALLSLAACDEPKENEVAENNVNIGETQNETNGETQNSVNQHFDADVTTTTTPQTQLNTESSKDSTEARTEFDAETKFLQNGQNSDPSDTPQPVAVKSVNVDMNKGTTKALGTENQAPSFEIQVTDVEYKDSQNRSIHVTFKTSATSTLQADLRLPTGERVLLTAPTAQGNNPTYRSSDGSIELVTHGGGARVDLFYNNKRTKFEAVETDAEVIKK